MLCWHIAVILNNQTNAQEISHYNCDMDMASLQCEMLDTSYCFNMWISCFIIKINIGSLLSGLSFECLCYQRVTIISRDCTYIFFAIPYLPAMGPGKGFQSMVEKMCIFCIYFCSRNTNSSRISYLTYNMCTLSKSHRICRCCTYIFL